ncbi:MAG TPA: HAMP domain-containing sensor histidine kinase [Longimicrobiales bacterium]
MLRRNSLERRLFGWMLVLGLVPALVTVAVGTWLWVGSLDLVGTLGPWDQIAESGRVVFEAAERAAAGDPELAEALSRHRGALSASLVLARRWAYLGERIVGLLPLLALGSAALLAWLALAVSRRLARQLARPIGELAAWAEHLAREEALPPPARSEAREVEEVRALRAAFRRASADLAAARQRALEAERVRVWGEMARRVAHEMKNPLTPLRLAAHRLARSPDGGPEFRESLAVIEEETDRLDELARQFAALGRPPEGPTSEVDVPELLSALLETDVPPAVEVALSAEPAVPVIEGHYDALLRAFRNLIRNAVEAMEGGAAPARLEVRIAVVPGEDDGTWAGRGAPTDARPPRWVEVTIADAGPGLPAGGRDRIFEPDYTTKSRGTGLGLALVRQAVDAHGGQVDARDRPGGGAEFTVRLPVAGVAATSA